MNCCLPRWRSIVTPSALSKVFHIDVKNSFSVEIIHINTTSVEPAPYGIAVSRAAPEAQQSGSGDELGLARVRDALHCGVHCLAAPHEDDLLPRP